MSGFLERQNGLLELKKRYLQEKKIQYCKFSLHLIFLPSHTGATPAL